jgi:hypothetical protein
MLVLWSFARAAGEFALPKKWGKAEISRVPPVQ